MIIKDLKEKNLYKTITECTTIYLFLVAGIPSALFLIVDYSTVIYIFNLSALFNSFKGSNIDIAPVCYTGLYVTPVFRY